MKFIGWAETNKVGSKCEFEFEIDDEDLEDLSDDERESLIQTVAEQALWDSGVIDWGWQED